MDERHKTILRRNRVFLVDNLDAQFLTTYLIQEEIFTGDIVEMIMAEKTRLHRIEKLLDYIPTRGPRAYSVFLESLRETYDFVFEHLQQYELTHYGSVTPPQSELQQPPEPNPVGYSKEFPYPTQEANGQGEPMSVDARANPGAVGDFYNTLPDDIKSRRISEKELCDISRKIGSVWEFVGIKLGFTQGQIEQFKMYNQFEMSLQCNKMLATWRSKEASNATIGNLLKVLKKCNVNIDEVCDKGDIFYNNV